jgi:hypothetical protein
VALQAARIAKKRIAAERRAWRAAEAAKKEAEKASTKMAREDAKPIKKLERGRDAAGPRESGFSLGNAMQRSKSFAGPSVIGSDIKEKHMKEETPEVETAGFVATKDEIENLALEYWNDVIDFKWDRFTWPDEPINTPQMDSFRLALIRLGDIAAVLGNERMEAIRYIALDRSRSPFTTDERWAAFMAYAPMFLRPVEVTL